METYPRWLRLEINPAEFPRDEQLSADRLNLASRDLSEYHIRLLYAMSLGHQSGSLFSKTPEPHVAHQAMGWKGIALRDATMTVFHFGQTLSNFERHLVACPSLASSSDMKALRDAKKAFFTAFPQRTRARNHVGHEADMDQQRNRTKEPFRSGGISVDIPNALIYGNITDDGLVAAVDGEDATLPINRETEQMVAKTRTVFLTSVKADGRLALLRTDPPWS